MRKRVGKLVLAKETLRGLDYDGLETAQGAGYPTTTLAASVCQSQCVTQCGNTCMFTCPNGTQATGCTLGQTCP